MNDKIKILSPATVANISCGYDVLGFCLDGIGDVMEISKTPEKGITIKHLDDFGLSENPTENVAGISALAMLDELNPKCGFHIEIEKKIKPGSGIGSSAASATGSVFGINQLMGNPYGETDLVRFAIEGESFASKCLHADNLAPAIFGGFTLVKSLEPLHILKLPTPKNLIATIIHPKIEIKTSEAKNILPNDISIKTAISQWANVGSLVHALHTDDLELLKLSLVDKVAEPYRAKLIPKFYEVKQAVLNAGAIGCGISGSGPSIFVLSEGNLTAESAAECMRNIYSETTIDFDIYMSRINLDGIKILNTN